jgi:hypothetical protein
MHEVEGGALGRLQNWVDPPAIKSGEIEVMTKRISVESGSFPDKRKASDLTPLLVSN